MFNTTLRTHSVWSRSISFLSESTNPHFQETALEAHDIAIPLPRGSTGSRGQPPPTTRFYRFLLLSAADLARPAALLLQKIERLASLAGTQECAVVFLLASESSGGVGGDEVGSESEPKPAGRTLDGVHGLMMLQKLYVPSSTTLPFHPVTALLPYATTTAPLRPLSEQARNVLSDLFVDLAALADACVGSGREETKSTLREWLSAGSADPLRGGGRRGEAAPTEAEMEAENVLAFWQHERTLG
ncbi:MAG: hypothetical protein M1826_005824 [Phylliscum demangeonii]|nr:MAG: hypothetical protein M1826_005824 [Phylliscum demangeonii]